MKNEMLALILAGGQGTRLGKLPNLRYNLVVATVSLTSVCLTVPTLALTMLVSLLSTNHWL